VYFWKASFVCFPLFLSVSAARSKSMSKWLQQIISHGNPFREMLSSISGSIFSETFFKVLFVLMCWKTIMLHSYVVNMPVYELTRFEIINIKSTDNKCIGFRYFLSW
jgi:hypothetical protein